MYTILFRAVFLLFTESGHPRSVNFFFSEPFLTFLRNMDSIYYKIWPISPKNRFLTLYGRWEALDGCKILPQGVGTICPYFWEIWLSTKNVHFDARFVCYYCVFKPLLSSMFETQCYRQNDQTDHRIIAWFSWKSHFDMVFANQIRVFHVKPTFSIVCIIDLFLCMQHIYIYIYIYMYIYIYIYEKL